MPALAFSIFDVSLTRPCDTKPHQFVFHETMAQQAMRFSLRLSLSFSLSLVLSLSLSKILNDDCPKYLQSHFKHATKRYGSQKIIPPIPRIDLYKSSLAFSGAFH
eukprot:GHVL01035111.1.p1 GENE.GHVL01035111.1~~GHVL01035111.1.p1  ORF type:complete len:105 (-),score=6.93 GHVL01035111.1:613-927(-)